MNKKLRTSLVLVGFVAFGLSVLAFASDPITRLVGKVRKFEQTELSTPGSTAIDPISGEKVFVGASATRVASIHEQSAQEHDALRARGPQERKEAIEAIRDFAGDPDLAVEYIATVPNPNVNGQMVELYWSDAIQTRYLVDPQGDIVREMILWNPALLTTTSTVMYSVHELEIQARNFLERKCVCFKQVEGDLRFERGEKKVEDRPSIRFFRWEITNPVADSQGLPPFIQIGISSNGRVVSYIDTICSGR